MTAYYNEIDPHAAQWLRNLIAAGAIAPGDIDERSIEDVTPNDLRGYTQCHFFAGIGGWAYALDLAGWPRDRPVWTGSCPCQPFSAAGKGAGFADERHLWPAWQHLINQCRPPVIFGEQVASKAVDAWIDLVHADMEGMGYAFGSVPFPAAGVGAPHIRDRNYWLADASCARSLPCALAGVHRGEDGSGPRHGELERSGSTGWLGYTDSAGLEGHPRHDRAAGRQGAAGSAAQAGLLVRLADADGGHASAERQQRSGQQRQQSQDSGSCDVANTTGSGRREECADAGGFDCGDRSQGFAAGLVRGSDDLLGLADSTSIGRIGRRSSEASNEPGTVERLERLCDAGTRPGPTNGQWRNADWIGCRDGKWRSAEPGTFPLAHGVSGRVGLLRGYGNAIVPQAAAEFIRSYAEAVGIRSEFALDLFAA